jgi:hypothetical protein
VPAPGARGGRFGDVDAGGWWVGGWAAGWWRVRPAAGSIVVRWTVVRWVEGELSWWGAEVGVVVPEAVVEAAAEAAVVLAGGAAVGPGDDVVALAVLGGHEAGGVVAAGMGDVEDAAQEPWELPGR